jgi:hypothetical protein
MRSFSRKCLKVRRLRSRHRPFNATPATVLLSGCVVKLHGVAGNYVPDRIKRKISRKWAAAHGTPMRESTVEHIDAMIQLVTRRS